ncbi:MAG: hypothetical protein AMJ69_02800 [Gammaproteobacteria bacterium SG8_47]|nr:MAG: hypothetical protein AMJ69_02800 [Gammaproteobacteria bacterium SG8_47]
MRAAVVLLLLALSPAWSLAEVGSKQVVGWVERVRLYPGELELQAKIDTGADSSSLHCTCITPVKRDGASWVQFNVENEDGEKVRLERKVLRTVTIKRHYGEAQERMVILLGLCVGKTYREIEVNLVDRGGFKYQLLVGRNFLAGDFLVDSSAKFLSEPYCEDAPLENE